MKFGRGLGKSLGLGKKGVAALGRGVGGVAGVVGGIVTIGVAFNEARKAIAGWTEAAMASAKKLAEVSGSMAAVMAERDIRQLARDVDRGEKTAGSTARLMESESNRKDQENRIAIAVDNLSNNVLSVLNEILAKMLGPIADLMDSIDKTVKAILGDGDVPPTGLASTLDDALNASRQIEASGKTLMDVARAAARAGATGTSAPSGATPPGGLP